MHDPAQLQFLDRQQLARIRFLIVLRPMTKVPHLRDRVQKCIKPKKSKVSGFTVRVPRADCGSQQRDPDADAAVLICSELQAIYEKSGPLLFASTRNHKSLRRRPLTRRWWTFDLVHTNGSASSL